MNRDKKESDGSNGVMEAWRLIGVVMSNLSVGFPRKENKNLNNLLVSHMIWNPMLAFPTGNGTSHIKISHHLPVIKYINNKWYRKHFPCYYPCNWKQSQYTQPERKHCLLHYQKVNPSFTMWIEGLIADMGTRLSSAYGCPHSDCISCEVTHSGLKLYSLTWNLRGLVCLL